MRHGIAETLALLAQAGANIFRQTILQLLNTRLRAMDARLRVLLIQPLHGALLTLVGTFELAFQRKAHPLTQALQFGLLTR